MLSSLILRTSVRFLAVLLVVFALFLLFRGHHSPGGGFGAGLVIAAAFGLYSLTYSVADAQQLLRIEPRLLITIGLLLALVSGMIGMLYGDPFLTGRWYEFHLGPFGKVDVGTPLLFEFGVFFTVVGSSQLILLMLQEAE